MRSAFGGRLLWLVLLGSSLVGMGQACLVHIAPLADEGGGGVAAPGSGGSGETRPPCPDDMIHVTATDNPLADYCIDAYEVTVRDHDTFLLAVQSGQVLPEQPSPACDGNVELRQTGTACPDKVPGPDRAVNCVDWCDAYAYCAYRGKRLCGRVGTGAGIVLEGSTFPGTVTDEWEYACSEGGRRVVPYEASGAPDASDICKCYFPGHWAPCAMGFECTTCTGPTDDNENRAGPATGYPECEGGYAGLFNMVGNVAEWTNRCDGEGPDATCIMRGGSIGGFGHYTHEDCQLKQRVAHRIDNLPFDDNAEQRFYVGIRCCLDAQR